MWRKIIIINYAKRLAFWIVLILPEKLIQFAKLTRIHFPSSFSFYAHDVRGLTWKFWNIRTPLSYNCCLVLTYLAGTSVVLFDFQELYILNKQREQLQPMMGITIVLIIQFYLQCLTQLFRSSIVILYTTYLINLFVSSIHIICYHHMGIPPGYVVFRRHAYELP